MPKPRWFPHAPDYPGWEQQNPMKKLDNQCRMVKYAEVPAMRGPDDYLPLTYHIGMIPALTWSKEMDPATGTYAIYRKITRPAMNPIFSKPLPLP